MPKETIGKTFFVAAALCVVCSLLVSTAAVTLRPTQGVNKLLDKKRNILTAAGLFDESRPIDELFESIEEKVGRPGHRRVRRHRPGPVRSARRRPRPGPERRHPGERDPAGIKRRARLAAVYLVYRKGEIDKVILPVHGKGLWSTLYGFLALDIEDVNTIRSLVYYEHGETPGLGGEVDNPRWKALWNGKRAFDEEGRSPSRSSAASWTPANPRPSTRSTDFRARRSPRAV